MTNADQLREAMATALAQFLDESATLSNRPYWYLVIMALDVLIDGLDGLDHAAALKFLDSTLQIRRCGENKPALVRRRFDAVKRLLDAGDLARAKPQGSA